MNAILRRVRALHEEGSTFDEIGTSLGVSKGTAHRLWKGIEPVDEGIRKVLGLPPRLPPNVQFHDVKACAKCGAPFVSNSGKRTRCFRCTPYRRR